MLPIVLAAALALSPLCDKPAPEPRGFHARGFGLVAEIFPPVSRQNAGERPLAYLYEVAHPGLRWEVNASRRWSAALPHDRFPSEALVSMDGHLVTLDDYFQVGQAHAVVLFDRTGRLLRSYALPELLSEAEIARLERSDCGVHWREGARYFFLLAPTPRLYVVLRGALALEFDLEQGSVRRGDPGTFGDLAEALSRRYANEEVEVWPLSLRFSSISDVLRGPTPP